MIDKKELRFGNLVALAHESNAPIVFVAQIKNRGIVWEVDGGNGYSGFDLLMPIKLTPEWLERCGFETPDGYQKTTYYNEIMIDYHMGEYKLRDKPKAQLKYLHQLQNIFYALTGQVLTITSFNQSN